LNHRYYLPAGLTSGFGASRQSMPSGSTRSIARIE
jgi:Glycogen recognition site of AMP-activated protein kinase